MPKLREFLSRWAHISEHTNWVLFWVSLIAFTRGVLYTIPTHEQLPTVLDLFPRGVIALYGVLWLLAGIYGFTRAFRRVSQHVARRLIGGVCIAWAIIYYGALVTDADEDYRIVFTAAFWTFMACISLASKMKVRVEFKTIFIVHGTDNEAGFVMIEPDEHHAE